jgi:hypothetical protein
MDLVHGHGALKRPLAGQKRDLELFLVLGEELLDRDGLLLVAEGEIRGRVPLFLFILFFQVRGSF